MHIRTNVCTCIQIHTYICTHYFTLCLYHVLEGISRLLLENTRICLQNAPPTSSPPLLSFLLFLPLCKFLSSLLLCVWAHTCCMIMSMSDSFAESVLSFHLHVVLGIELGSLGCITSSVPSEPLPRPLGSLSFCPSSPSSLPFSLLFFPTPSLPPCLPPSLSPSLPDSLPSCLPPCLPPSLPASLPSLPLFLHSFIPRSLPPSLPLH